MLSIILLSLFIFNNITATETKSASIPVLVTNILEDMTERVQQLRQRINQCESEYNILDHYIIDLRDKRVRSKTCCNQWHYKRSD
jgi:hypothetical protein